MTPRPGGRTLILLRHGRTAWNHERRMQGQHDIGLDEVGHQQAARAAAAIVELRPAVLVSSDLARARETAAPLAEATGLVLTYDARLREFSFGALETLTYAEFAERDPTAYDALARGDYDGVPDAERTAAVRERMLTALVEVRDALDPGDTAVVVSHGAAIRVATAAFLGWPDPLSQSLGGLDNCGRVEVVETAEADRWRLRAYNRVG